MQVRAAAGAEMLVIACSGSSATIGPVEPKAKLETCSRNLPDFVSDGFTANESVVCEGTLTRAVAVAPAIDAFGARGSTGSG